ncbi:uncharacterized protein LOC110225698 isoform X2 [Arabidopsis lyrata subsp. lyrata]|uniref:uncharacterized protein LOC110225698 isoform X2 n=1 Tax=Arabidopsis lyrata subsp. lyrata TaxID=81972 RepID=UPI000A29DE11|nr:uncharacterized protein LOC110225698 isoform X2 [Arabidopsis lyrata subsp. lyrata]|eukprot:XP_020871273.1 uncharacterized protein LOC110225698 isoform X2 [Arabidopsis lyrata subsp. lyrata]
MGMSGSSGLGHVLMLLLLLSILFHHTESALPSDHEQLSVTGRRMMANYKPNAAVETPPSRSRRGGGGQNTGGD